jgi:hypothetical protein
MGHSISAVFAVSGPAQVFWIYTSPISTIMGRLMPIRTWAMDQSTDKAGYSLVLPFPPNNWVAIVLSFSKGPYETVIFCVPQGLLKKFLWLHGRPPQRLLSDLRSD